MTATQLFLIIATGVNLLALLSTFLEPWSHLRKQCGLKRSDYVHVEKQEDKVVWFLRAGGTMTWGKWNGYKPGTFLYQEKTFEPHPIFLRSGTDRIWNTTVSPDFPIQDGDQGMQPLEMEPK